MNFGGLWIGAVMAIAVTMSSAARALDHSSVDGECESNFSVQGSTASGKTFLTSGTLTGVSKADAVTTAAAKVTKDGLVVVTADQDAGLVVATNRVANGKGEDSILEIKISEQLRDQLTVAMRFPLRPGLVAENSMIRDKMCRVIGAIKQK